MYEIKIISEHKWKWQSKQTETLEIKKDTRKQKIHWVSALFENAK